MRVIVIINKAHSLMKDQARAIEDSFPESDVHLLQVPEEGWNLKQVNEVAATLDDEQIDAVVFASPIPALILSVSRRRQNFGVYALHNDKRIAKEVRTSEGTIKVIHTIAPDGWEIA